jgi:hypothetical protein
MPNTKTTRSIKKSGMNKADDGGVAFQGFPEDFNSTYPSNEVDSDAAEDAPYNDKYAERLPDTIEPLGTVNLTEVSRGGKS